MTKFKVGDRVRQVMYADGDNPEAVIVCIRGNNVGHRHKGSNRDTHCSLYTDEGKCCFELLESYTKNIKQYGIVKFLEGIEK